MAIANSTTLLLNAAESGDAAALSKALQSGADVDAKNLGGLTAMLWAAIGGHVDCLSLLVKAGADIEAKDSDGLTASMLAANNGHTECHRMLEAEIERRALIDDISMPSTPKARSPLRV